MDLHTASTVPDWPGKTSFWTAPRRAGKYDLPEASPEGAQSCAIGVGSLDNVRSVFWQAYRHLFPPHALAAQAPDGSVVVSWSVQDEPRARYPYAAPVMLHFDEHLVKAMWKAQPGARLRIARRHETELREGMRGYDPYARAPSARVVNIG
jgi:hypothetical protein